MKTYTPTIGLEIHAELRTNTKMFCSCKNDPDEKRPNVNVCPVCMAHPGTLPVINGKAVEHILKMGIALSGSIADFTEFDRKNYFYPDIPKGYQISQYKYPLISGGTLRGVSITRVHLEEDTARSQHLPAQAGESGEYSLIDYNRAGVPLMELVTEPVMHSAEEAGAFARELQLLLRTIGAGEANMEKGEMRVEANISISDDPKKFGTKVEVKNLNSFRAVERAIAFEIQRHRELLEKGESVVQETRGWDDAKQQTFSQRLKENSHDYRYFPDPDLPKLSLSIIEAFSRDALSREMPELPWKRRERYVSALGLKQEDADALTRDPELAAFFESSIRGEEGNSAFVQLAANYLLTDLIGLTEKDSPSFSSLRFSPESFATLIALIRDGKISSRGAKDILGVLFREGGDPAQIMESRGLAQKADETELRQVVEKVIEQNMPVVNEFCSGKEAVLKFLVGQGMKESRGSANPQVLEKLFRELCMKHCV